MRQSSLRTRLPRRTSHREALIEPLLSALERGIANPASASIREANLFSYALYLLAKWREPRAYRQVIRWLSLPEEKPFEIGGDIVTQDGARILAAVCDGDLTPIKNLILNRDADQYGRGAGVSALALLAAWAEIPREPILEYFLWLAEGGLEPRFYSASATVGFMRVARRAGNAPAVIATIASITVTATSTVGSTALTPNNRLSRLRLSASTPPAPTRSPAPTSMSASRSTS